MNRTDPPPARVLSDRFTVKVVLDSGVMDERAILDEELVRARHALAYLKGKIGNEAMRDLLADDLARTTAEVGDWVERSNGRWRTGHVELVVPGPSAKVFHDWYEQAIGEHREEALRAGHPEHFILHPDGKGAEVVENIGETDLPWRVFYRTLADGAYPLPWDDDYPERFGAEIVDADGRRVGYTMHQLRDGEDGLHLLLRTLLPEAAPSWLVERHLRHFSIEFFNWTHAAWRESQS